MDEATFRAMEAIAETYETTGVVSMRPLGRPLAGEAGPNVGPQAQRADPALDKAILHATMELESAMLKARRDLGNAYNKLIPLKGSNPTHEHLHMVLAIIQQAYQLCQELENTAKTDLRQA